MFQANEWHVKNEGKTEIQKFEYVDNEKSFLDEIKTLI